jgi:class 3 adenylate cyclase
LPAADDELASARSALDRHAWDEAYERFNRADHQAVLSGADLEALASAAFFTGHAEAETEAEERAFKAYQAEGNEIRAGYLALQLGRVYAYKGKLSIAAAWVRRAERLLDGQPESFAHGFLALARSDIAQRAGDVETALEQAETAVRIGMTSMDADLEATAQVALGALKIITGATSDGLGLMEEATIAAVNGELSPFVTGITYCAMISACRDLTDFTRASEWTEATERWCERQSVSGFPGICRVHRAEVMALGGSWERAEAELRQATTELAAYNAVPPMADGYYALGELQLRMGDLEMAEQSLREAHGLGRAPQPALARLRLAQGNVRAAATAIHSSLDEHTWDQLGRLRLLPAQVEIAIAAGDVATARAAAEELDRLTDAYDSPALRATRHEARGRVRLAEGDAAEAARELRAAVGGWREVNAPYEVARVREQLAVALRALDDEDEADLELDTARAEFVRLGARLDAEAATAAIEAVAERRAGPHHARRTFMFTDIVGSTSLAEALGDEAWERLLQRHDDIIREQAGRTGGMVVNSTGDGFFIAFDSARQAVDCAIGIQRALVAHREKSGFAPPVRIGLHSAEASQRGGDYSGIGVHLAARVAALADGGEIVATTETLVEAGDVEASDPREASLRGVTAPVAVASVSWS